MKKASKKSPDNCPLCGQYMDVICSGYRFKPFIDGQCYEYICHCCHTIPCAARFDKDTWHTYDFSDKELHTVEELVSQGFEEKEAKISLKALKAAMKKHK